MRKYIAVIASIAFLSITVLHAGDGPISSSLPFFTEYTSLVPTPYSTIKSDPTPSKTTITYRTRHGITVLRQQWLPPSEDGSREVHNEIFNGAGKPRILEVLRYSSGYNTIEIKSFRMDHSLIATLSCDGHGHPSRIADTAGDNLLLAQYKTLLREVLATP